VTLFPGSITDVQGLKVGHHTDARRPTGCTVVLCEDGVVCGVDVRGAAPGTRETDLLAPGNLVERVHALLLAGGSAFGLDAASGVMRWLDQHGHGLVVGPARVPIVPAAVLFDLWLGDARIRPDADAGFAACEAASVQPPAQGSFGAGAGATGGKLFGIAHAMKGGIGSASVEVCGVRVAALVAVNAVGDVIDPGSARVVAGSRQHDGRTPRRISAALARGVMPPNVLAGASTTIGIVATDAVLDKAQCARVATMSHDGLARCIDPVHTASDGDTMFALATGSARQSLPLTVLGALAAEVTQRAVLNGVRAATGVREPPLPCAQDLGWA
jgi:L-aminopeptidase/D-esterase-like protein